jgi:hypothetical protein
MSNCLSSWGLTTNYALTNYAPAKRLRDSTTSTNTAGRNLLTANENRGDCGELENERDDCATAASVRMDGQKRVYFRAVEYKATSSKNSKERKDQGHPTQPIAHGVANTEPTGTCGPVAPQSSLQVSPKLFDSCADGLRRFLTDLFYIRSVATDWICCN